MDATLQALLEQGRERFLAHDYASAEKLLVQVSLAAKGFADVHNMLGVIFHDQGRFAKALEEFQEALRINPNYTEACLNLAVTYNDLGMYNEARAVFGRARQEGEVADGTLEPFAKGKLANLHADLGGIYASMQLWKEAEEELRKALSLRPDFADIRTELGKVLREAGRKEESVKELLEAKKSRPNFPPAGVQLGITYYSLGRLADATAEWKSVLATDPANSRAKMFLRLVSEMEKKA